MPANQQLIQLYKVALKPKSSKPRLKLRFQPAKQSPQAKVERMQERNLLPTLAHLPVMPVVLRQGLVAPLIRVALLRGCLLPPVFQVNLLPLKVLPPPALPKFPTTPKLLG